MARDDSFELNSIAIKILAIFACLCEGGKRGNHVPIIVQGLLECDFFPFGGLDGEVCHGQR
jgi:hypothetical protein